MFFLSGAFFLIVFLGRDETDSLLHYTSTAIFIYQEFHYNQLMELQEQADWYQYLEVDQQDLVKVSFALLQKKNLFPDLRDFSFLVFPLSKAYEGFLKKVFYDLNLITKETYQGRRFRIGRALNPDIREYQRDEDWLYDDVESHFGREIARQLWDTWLQCRNRVFHYFTQEPQTLTFPEAMQKIEMLIQSMQAVAKQLNINQNKRRN